MSLAGATKSVRNLLQTQYEATFTAGAAPTFLVSSPHQFSTEPSNSVTVLVYRVQQDATRRHVDLPPVREAVAANPARLRRRAALALEVYILLTAWVSDPEGELLVLSRCMDILDRHPILSGPLLDPGYPWPPETTIRVSMAHQSPEETFQLWETLLPTFRLSIPYVLRTVRLEPQEVDAAPPVGAATRVYVPSLPPPEET